MTIDKKNADKYDSHTAFLRYEILTDEMLYNIIMNLRSTGMSFDELAEAVGLTKEELLEKITDKHKDFFTCLESIAILEEKENYKDYGFVKKYGAKE